MCTVLVTDIRVLPLQVISSQFVPALLEPILKDYAESLPDAKCAHIVVIPCPAFVTEAVCACQRHGNPLKWCLAK